MPGEYGEALAEAGRGVASLIEIGDACNLAFALGFRAAAAGVPGQFDKAFEYATRGPAVARQTGAAQPLLQLTVTRTYCKRSAKNSFNIRPLGARGPRGGRGRVHSFDAAVCRWASAAPGRRPGTSGTKCENSSPVFSGPRSRRPKPPASVSPPIRTVR